MDELVNIQQMTANFAVQLSREIVGASKTDLGSSKGPTNKYNVIFTNIARELIVL